LQTLRGAFVLRPDYRLGMGNKILHSLITLEQFKAVLNIDDRDDMLSKSCLEIATKAIENYCKRNLLRKKHFEQLEYTGELQLPLGEYPVNKVLVVYALPTTAGDGEIIEPDFYSIIPECGTDCDYQFSISLSRAFLRYQGLSAIKAVYWAGYVVKPHPCGFTTRSFCDAKTPAKALKTAASMPPVPPDLSAACLELASWNMNRYKGRRIGMTGNVRSGGKDGEHFELSMPENVKNLLEPYRRKVI
jgi:hypothetical protein